MPFRTLILNNFWLKVFSLVLATLIWFAIQSNQTNSRFPQTLLAPKFHTAALSCPVRIITSPTSRAAYNIEPERVIVRVRGDEAVLSKLTPDSIQAYIRPTNSPNLNNLFRVEVIVPRDVSLKEVSPEEVLVQSIISTNKPLF